MGVDEGGGWCHVVRGVVMGWDGAVEAVAFGPGGRLVFLACVLCCVGLCCFVLCCAVLCCADLCCAVLTMGCVRVGRRWWNGRVRRRRLMIYLAGGSCFGWRWLRRRELLCCVVLSCAVLCCAVLCCVLLTLGCVRVG